MWPKIFVDGVQREYPGDFTNLEDVLRSIMEEQLSFGRVVKAVKKDRVPYSEIYEHQAAESSLDKSTLIEVETQAIEDFSRDFITHAHHFIDQLKNGFALAADLLSSPTTVEEGFGTLAMSFEAMQNLKAHIDAVGVVLNEAGPVSERETSMWNEFQRLADSIIDSQQKGEPEIIAGLLKDHMLGVLNEWREIRLSALSG